MSTERASDVGALAGEGAAAPLAPKGTLRAARPRAVGTTPWLLGLLENDERFAGSRVLEGRFHVVEQAVGTPRGRGDAALPFLEAFVAEATGGGLVAELIREHGVEGKVVVAS